MVNLIDSVIIWLYRAKDKILYDFDKIGFLLNIFIILTLGFCMYLKQKYSIFLYDNNDNDNNGFITIISLTIYVLTLYGIFFAFLQFLIVSNSNRTFFWGINKIEFSILNKFIYRIVNIFATKLIILAFIIAPIANAILKDYDLILTLDKQQVLLSIWEVCLIYLMILFGFLLTQSLTALFLVFKIENKADSKIEKLIKRFKLKQSLFSVKKGIFWNYFDEQKKCIESDQLLNFISYIFKGVLNYLFHSILKNRLGISSYRKKSNLELDTFLNERWGHVKELSVVEKTRLLKTENDHLNDFIIFHKDDERLKTCILKVEDYFEPFFDILPDLKRAEDLEVLLKTLNNYYYFHFLNDESDYSDQAYRIARELINVIKNNFLIITNDDVEWALIKLNNNKKVVAKSFFEIIYFHERENSEDQKEFIKFMLNTLGPNYIYAFIFYCILHYGSPSETVFQDDIYYFRKLYFFKNRFQVIDNNKICDLVEGTNIGHRIQVRLINWLLNNLKNDLNNEILVKICKFEYLDYYKFLKIRFIFSDGNMEGQFYPEYFCVWYDIS